MRKSVEADTPEAKRFLTALRDVLSVPKAKVQKAAQRKQQANKQPKRARKA